MALKILHTADWHLGRRFGFSDEDNLKLSRARLDAVERILGVAESYAVDAVLCAGDLFDDSAPTEDWWRGLPKLFQSRSWESRPVFLLPGNHDALLPNSVWAPDHPFRRELPSWVHVIDRDDFEFELSDEAVLYAVPCRSRAGAEDPALRLPNRQPHDERIRIGLVHGQTFDIKDHQTNFPISADAAAQRGLNYLAIGDTHAFREVQPSAQAPTVYPGTPEATNFKETDTGFVAVVFFPRGGRKPLVNKESVSRWSWRAECCSSLQELEDLSRQDLQTSVVRLALEMDVSLPQLDRAEAILRELKGTEAAHGRAGVFEVDRSGLKLNTSNLDEFAQELPDVLQTTLERLQSLQQGERAAVAERAIYHLYRSFQEEGR